MFYKIIFSIELYFYKKLALLSLKQSTIKKQLFKLLLLPGNTKRGSITVPLTSCLTGLDSSVLQIKTKIVSRHTADSKPVKQDVNGTVILPPLVFPAFTFSVLPCINLFLHKNYIKMPSCSIASMQN